MVRSKADRTLPRVCKKKTSSPRCWRRSNSFSETRQRVPKKRKPPELFESLTTKDTKAHKGKPQTELVFFLRVSSCPLWLGSSLALLERVFATLSQGAGCALQQMISLCLPA